MDDQLKATRDEHVGEFQSLFLTFFPKVKAMLLRQGADEATAEEIAQDTMFAVWRKKHQYARKRGSIAAWIYAIARNLRIDRIRRQVVWRRFYTELESIEQLHSGDSEIEACLGERDEIESALRGLSPAQLEIIQLCFVDGLTQREIASKLALPLGTVKSRMRLAYEKLRVSAGRQV